MKFQIITTFAIMSLASCQKINDIDVYQSQRDNVIDVKKHVKTISIEDNVVLGNATELLIADNYLVFHDKESYDKLIHIFDKNTFKHQVSFGDIGQGPFEIASLGGVVWNRFAKELYLTDFGSMNYYSYNIDSAIIDRNYRPYIKSQLDPTQAIIEYEFIDNDKAYGSLLRATGNYGFEQTTCVWNILTGETDILEYKHEKIKNKRNSFAISAEDSIYAECNMNCDLISIFDINGNLIHNIYGPNWESDDLKFYDQCLFTKDCLFVLYNGEQYVDHSLPNTCIVFSKEGEYLATLNIGYSINVMCYDKLNNRLYFVFDDVIQFGYIDIDEIKIS